MRCISSSWNRRWVAHHEAALAQVLDFQRRDLRIALAVIVDEIMEVGALVRVDAPHRLAHRAIEGDIGFGVDPVGSDLGAVEEGGAN